LQLRRRRAAARIRERRQVIVQSFLGTGVGGAPEGDAQLEQASVSAKARAELLRKALRRRISDQQFATWFERTDVGSWQGGLLTLDVPNGFYLEWIQRNFLGVIAEAAREVANAPVRVSLAIRSGPPAPTPAPTAAEQASAGAPLSHASQLPAAEPPSSTPSPVPARSGYQPTPFSGSGPLDTPLRLSAHYTFDNFVTGPSNTVAHASAHAVAQKPGRAYNPLFIHGSVGLGKTHLLQAICRTFMETYPQDRICFLSCEEFTNEFIQALQKKDVQRFRDRFRNVHLLVIDDIHFLKGKEQTQEEFFHTFNELYNVNRQIVLSSDAAPAQIPSLEDRLISRFQWGLVTKLEQPDMETRMAIINRKAELQGIQMCQEVSEYIAANFKKNIRELEGALSSLQAHAEVMGLPIDLMLAKEALEPSLPKDKRIANIDDVVALVCELYGVTVSDLQGPKRHAAISKPRQIAMYLTREVTQRSYEEIGNFFGGRDHSTVLYAAKRVATQRNADSALSARLDRLADRLEAR
jgi:chromosomal replication initiator protein